MPTPYVKQTWIDGVAGATPISAARLTYIEDGIENATVEDGTYVPAPSSAPTRQYMLRPAVGAAVEWALASAYGRIRNARDFAATNAQLDVLFDGESKPLSGFYATLAEAQADYPHAAALTDELDWAVVQASWNAVTPGSGAVGGYPAVAVELGTGTPFINRTLELIGKGLLFRGGGTGNPTYAANPGLGTTFKWGGAAGVPMMKFRDCRNIYASDFNLVGDDTNPPSEGMYFEALGGESLGTNQMMVFERIVIGHTREHTTGYQMDYCVRFGGHNTNNDQFTFNNCDFNSPLDTCFKIDNSQSIWGTLNNCQFAGYTDNAKGLVTAAAVTLYNAQFVNCAVDIEVAGTAAVNVFGWWSELSSLIFDVTSNGHLSVYGGRWTIQSPMQGAPYIGRAPALTNNLSLQVDVVYNITPQPPVYVRGTFSTQPYTVYVRNCLGLTTAAHFDIQGYGVAGHTYVDIFNGGVVMQGNLVFAALTKTHATKTTATIGDGVATVYNVAHNRATTNILVQCWRISTLIFVTPTEIKHVDTNTVRLTFATAPATNDIRVMFIS